MSKIYILFEGTNVYLQFFPHNRNAETPNIRHSPYADNHKKSTKTEMCLLSPQGWQVRYSWLEDVLYVHFYWQAHIQATKHTRKETLLARGGTFTINREHEMMNRYDWKSNRSVCDHARTHGHTHTDTQAHTLSLSNIHGIFNSSFLLFFNL